MAARVVTAVGAGVINSAASSTAAAIVPPERRGRALAFVLGGLTLATALGLPLGTLIGSADWRVTLWAVAGTGLVAAVGVAVGLPAVRLPPATLADRLRPLARGGRVPALLAVTTLAFLGTYTLYTYVAPALRDATDGDEPLLTLVLLAWGVGVLAGNTAAGRLVDRRDPARVLTGPLALAVLALALTPSPPARSYPRSSGRRSGAWPWASSSYRSSTGSSRSARPPRRSCSGSTPRRCTRGWRWAAVLAGWRRSGSG